MATEGDGSRVLVVEDDEEVRRLLCRILELSGYTTADASNGLGAFVQLRLALPRVVVLDLMMPSVNGFQVAERMRDHPLWRHVPIIVMTASIHLEEQIRAMNAAIVLRKPFSMEELLDAVATVLPTAEDQTAVSDQSSGQA